MKLKSVPQQQFPFKAMAMLALTVAIVFLLLGLNKEYAKSKSAPLTLSQAQQRFNSQNDADNIVPIPASISPTVEISHICVFNNSNIPDLARIMANKLRDQGWQIDMVGNYKALTNVVRATIFYPKLATDSAKKLAQNISIPMKLVVQDPDISLCPNRLEVVLVS